ncbi:unnamed protein product [Orchesella dallaii]|uniref:C3H1-type domain-containing protein n=1 Tax=Orchesella dallaii TaxID=48710 RepID=A0ABP1RXK1_9HEXA
MQDTIPNGGDNDGDGLEITEQNGRADNLVNRSKYAAQAMQQLGEGNLYTALQLLNLCLGDTEETEPSDLELQLDDLIKDNKGATSESTENNQDDYDADESSLIEKRCLVNMRLKRFSKVVHDAKKMLDISGENPVAYKCLLAALCKMKKLEQANEVIRLWQKNSPRDLEMMECRTKLESLMVAVKNGIEASDAFSDVEDLLGLNYDWLLLRKSKDPQWKYRPLPASSHCSFVLCLQYRFGHCSLGEKCPDAHGEGELEEWKKRYEIENVTRRINSLNVDDNSTYVKDVLAKLQEAVNKTDILCDDSTEDIKVSCAPPLHTTVQQRKFKKFTWKFTVETMKPLDHICLLYDHHRQYFHITSCSLVGPKGNIVLKQAGKGEALSQQVITPHVSDAAISITGSKANSYKYKVNVAFIPEVYGNFQQSVIFDIGSDPKIVRNISVDVVAPLDSEADKVPCEGTSTSPVDRSKVYRTNIPWNFGNAEMIDGNSGEKVSSEKLGFALISGSSLSKPESFMENTKDPLSKEHYKERMRFLLTQEERARQEILAKYNVTTNVHLSEKYMCSGGYNEGMTRYAIDGALFGRINLFRDISEDTAVGRLILRSCNAVLLAKSEDSRTTESDKKIKVYFCPISDKTKNCVYLDLGKTCVSHLDLKEDDVVQFDIQFQLDRTAFIEQKKVIDQLEEKHLAMLFPDLAINCNIPWNPIKQWSEIETSQFRLNPKQKEALIAITAENCQIPPILVIGPFGTGKTFTLAQCIRKILTQTDTRVMVCTHSNSAADLYIKEYLDSWVKEGFTDAKPLRIYYEMRNLSSVHPTVLQYCTLEAMKFRPPTYEEVLNHRVIVVTLSTSYLLMEMNLPKDTFSHILLDEAAQAMESEAITPLMSAGKSTKLVLAGDHMQLSPELFSEEARNIHPSLLERLHALYPDSHPCKLMLCENYRSHSAIIQFVSDSFYTRKLECAKSQPVHDNFFPLTFFAARGEDVQDSESTSYYNMAEVFEVTEKISELISSWPEKWGDYRDESAIGVLTPYADQVTRIRTRLRKKGLHSVSVERVFNVQGKQFRAVFLSTVRSFRPWVRILPEAVGNEVDLGFFSSPKLLNTALTRAQSLVAVVGDPVSLCSVGKCRRIWEDYIRIAHENKSLFGITFIQLKQSILGVEMRLTWGLNPLANEFQPQSKQTRGTATSVPIMSSSGVQANLSQMPISQQFSNRRQRQPMLYTDPNLGFFGPHQHFPDVHVMASPQQAHTHIPSPAIFQGAQPPILARPPYVAGVNIVPQFPPFVPPPITPWSQPQLQLQPYNQAIPWPNASLPPAVNIRGSSQRPVQFQSTSPLHHPSQLVQANNATDYIAKQAVLLPYIPKSTSQQTGPFVTPNLSGAGTHDAFNSVNSNANLVVKNSMGSPSQQQYATGLPLYRRPTSTGNSIQPQNHVQQTQPPFDDHGTYNQPPPYPVYEQTSHHGQQKFTPEELNFITRALDQHASSGEPFHVDLQSLRTKLIQAVNSGDAAAVRPTAHGTSSVSNYSGAYSGEKYLHGQYGYQGANGPLGTSNPQGTGVVPVPQKSPVMPADRYLYNSGFQESSAGVSLQNRVWSAPNQLNQVFPTPNESINTVNAPGYHAQQNVHPVNEVNALPHRGQTFLDPNRGMYPNQTGNLLPSNNVMSQQGLPNRSLNSYNNNSVMSQYEYGPYQTDVGGLKAQLSGGIRQGFGDRSAFSRVYNGNQDMDVVSDSSGLGRSYANVVKAAVTAAVGSGVSTSITSASNVPRMPVPAPSAAVSSNIYPNSVNVYGGPGQGMPSSHTHFVPQL